MTVRSIAELKTNMSPTESNSVSTLDLHDIADTLEERSTQRISVKTTSYTASIADNGSKLCFNSPSPVTLTLPSNIPTGWGCIVSQTGAGQVTMAVPQGAVLSRGSVVTAGVNAVCCLLCISNPTAAPQIVLAGDIGGAAPTV